MRRFGKKLRALRTHRQMTLDELAIKLGYTTHSYLSEIETGKKQPTVNLVLSVAQLFHVTTDELLKDNIETKPSDRGNK
jgi:transcriptional regulator with XRE-family HTH domain